MISYVKRYGKFYKVENGVKTRITLEEWEDAMRPASEPEMDPLEALRAQATTYESFEEAVEDHGEDEEDLAEIEDEKLW